LPSRGNDAQQPAADRPDIFIYLLTIYDHPHILNETIDDLKRLRRRRKSLVLGESVKPLKDSIDFIISKKFLY
jgi:hypothetical protein